MTVLQLCKFDGNGCLSLSSQDLNQVDYIAISHVWGDPSEISLHDVSGIPSKVPLSPQKARFLSEQLPGLVKNQFFWMDVLAVDQSSRESRISVVRHIPEIYREADLTIIVRESGGLQECCTEILDGAGTEAAVFEVWKDLDQHLNDDHPHGIQEVWLERNWPLQELALSNSIRFCVCSAGREPKRLFSGDPFRNVAVWQTTTLAENVKSIGKWWAGCPEEPSPHMRAKLARLLSSGDESGSADNEDASDDGSVEGFVQRLESSEEFVNAFLSNAEASRSSYHDQNSDIAACIRTFSGSTRMTGRAADFVLAIFPQFPWYQVPNDLARLEFGDLYQNCMLQLAAISSEAATVQAYEGPAIRVKITQGMLLGLETSPDLSKRPASKVPVPTSLGDFFRLMHIAERNVETASESFWHLRPVSTTDSAQEIISLVSDTLWYGSPNLSSFFQQFALWNSAPDQLLNLVGGGSAGVPPLGAGESEAVREMTDTQTNPREELLRRALDPMRAIVYMSNFAAIQWQESSPSLMSHTKDLYQSFNPNLTAFAAQNLQNFNSTEAKLTWLYEQLLTFESEDENFRKTLLLLATAAVCDFGWGAIPWLDENMQIYALKRFDFNAEADGQPMETLVFAAKGLDTDLLNEEFQVEANARGLDPYLVVSKEQDEGEKQTWVVGLVPKQSVFESNSLHFPDDKRS